MVNRISCTDRAVGQLLARYELDLLDADERELFEQHVLDCRFCQQEITAFLPAVNHIHRRKSELMHQLQTQGLSYESLRNQLIADTSSPARPFQNRILSLWQVLREWWGRPLVWAPAVALTCVVLLAVLIQTKGHSRYERYITFDALPFEGTLTRGNSETELEYYQGVQAYQNGEWSSAIKHLGWVTAADSTQGEAWLYLGISHYVKRQSRESIRALEYATRWAPHHLYLPAKWYLAQAYLLDNRRSDAEAELEQVARSPGPFAEKADDLLAHVRETPP